MPLPKFAIYHLSLGLLAGLTLAAIGCKPQDEIRSYTVSKQTPKQATSQSTEQAAPAGSAASPASASIGKATTEATGKATGEPTHRMMAAMVRGADRAWFFKLVGTIDQLKTAGADVEKFLSTLKSPKTGPPTWETPEGWTERAASGMRLATLLVPTEAGELELSVIGLPLVGDWKAQTLDNLNRWRGQMGQPPIKLGQLAENVTQPDEADDAVVMDFTGQFAGGMSAAPFAGGGAPFAPKPPVMTKPPATAETVEPKTPLPPAPPAEEPEFTFDAPAEWKALPTTSMRLANLKTSDTDTAAEVKAFVFSAAAPMMADPLANVNRWRGQVGLDETTQAELDKSSEKIKVAGLDATYVELIGEKDAITAAMIPRGGQVWFFMMSGPAETLQSEQERFREWLKTIKFTNEK